MIIILIKFYHNNKKNNKYGLSLKYLHTFVILCANFLSLKNIIKKCGMMNKLENLTYMSRKSKLIQKNTKMEI